MKRTGQSLRIVAGLALLAILILIATYEYQTLKMEELPFETIEQAKTADVTKQWKGTEPRLLIVAHPEDISEAQQYVTDKATVVLSRLDFTKHFAIIAFQELSLFLCPPHSKKQSAILKDELDKEF